MKWSEGKTIKCKKDFWAATETRRRRKTFSVLFLLAFSPLLHLFSAVFCQASSERASLPLLLPSRCFIPVSSPPRPGNQNNTKNRPPLPFPRSPPDICRHLPSVAPPDVLASPQTCKTREPSNQPPHQHIDIVVVSSHRTVREKKKKNFFPLPVLTRLRDRMSVVLFRESVP